MLKMIGFFLLATLKFFGICVLVIFALLFFVLLCILLLPVRYQFEGEYHPAVGTKERFYVMRAQVHWLCRILSVVFSYDVSGSRIRIAVFGLNLDRIREWKKKLGRRKQEKKQTVRPDEDDCVTEEKKELTEQEELIGQMELQEEPEDVVEQPFKKKISRN